MVKVSSTTIVFVVLTAIYVQLSSIFGNVYEFSGIGTMAIGLVLATVGLVTKRLGFAAAALFGATWILLFAMLSVLIQSPDLVYKDVVLLWSLLTLLTLMNFITFYFAFQAHRNVSRDSVGLSLLRVTPGLSVFGDIYASLDHSAVPQGARA